MLADFTSTLEPTPFELLDVLVQNRRDGAANRSLLSLHFVGKRGPQTDRLKMPLLTWFDANQLQQFTRQLAAFDLTDRPTRTETCSVDLPDSGLRLSAGGKNRRSIRVEALPTAQHRFTPVVISSTATGLRQYANLLYTRLWEAFCRG